MPETLEKRRKLPQLWNGMRMVPALILAVLGAEAAAAWASNSFYGKGQLPA